MKKLLLRGLKFCPTPKFSNIPQLQCDIKIFARALRLREFFLDKTNDDTSLVRNPSSWIPNENRDRHLEDCIRRLNRLSDNLEDESTRSISPNLSKSELTALGQLIAMVKEKRIWIAESDKGGLICIFDHDYIGEYGRRILEDQTTFQLVPQNCGDMAQRAIISLLSRHPNICTKNEREYLTKYETKDANLYFLPKPLKNKAVMEAKKATIGHVLTMPPPADLDFRGIIGGPTSATSHLSELIDIVLQPLIPHIPGYLKDSFDVIRHIDSTWRPMVESGGSYSFYTWDIKSFYPSISFQLLREALSYWLNELSHLVNQRFTHTFILEAVEIVTSFNHCVFDNRSFKFVKGLATGTNAAVCLAVMVRGYLLHILCQRLTQQGNGEIATYTKEHLKAFIDDNAFLWNDNLGSIDIINQQFDWIKAQYGVQFIMVNSEENRLPNGDTAKTQYFLDLTIHLTPSTIIVDQYDKSCHNFVPWNSCHPHNTKKNIPYALALRIRTLCDDENDQKRRMKSLAAHLGGLGYPDAIINDAINKAMARDQMELRREKDSESTSDVLAFVHTFNPRHPQIFPRILKALDIMNDSPRMKQIMDKVTVVPSKRQPPNLKSLLTRSNYSTVAKKGEVKKCGKNCATCPYMIEGDFVQMENGEVFHFQETLTCHTKNVVYAMFCAGCDATYIGETGQPFNKRLSSHRTHINRAEHRKLQVSEHIFQF